MLTYKVILQLNDYAQGYMLVEAKKVERITDYSFSADNVVIKLNEPIVQICVVTMDNF